MHRFFYGLILGAAASIAMFLANRLGLSSGHWLRKKAIMLCCRMSSLGGGVDEGADALMEIWGRPAQELLHTMRCNNEISRSARHGAYVYDSIDHDLCTKWKAGAAIQSVKFSYGQAVSVNYDSYVDQQGKVIELHQANPFPIYIVQLNSGDRFHISDDYISAHV